jgi:glycosyltransferase involved in cell wall biosynthesis
MRLGIISSSYPRSPTDSTNAGVFVRDLAHKLFEADLEVVVLTPQKVIETSESRFPVKSFPWPGDETSLSHVNARKPLNMARFGILLASGAMTCLRVFKAERIDHVLALWAVPSGLFAWVARKTLGMPYSVWALGSDIWRIRDYPLGEPLLRRVLKDAEHIYADGIVLSQDAERIAGRQCVFLPTSCELPEPGATQAPVLQPDRTHLLCVARFHPHKGVDILIDAVGLIPEGKRRAMQFHVFGGGPQEGLLKAKVRQYRLEQCVRIGGYIGRNDLAAYLRAVRCLIISSRIESIPLILSDAAQAGCPVIATDVGDMGHLVRDYGVGLCVPPESPQALAEGILRFHEGIPPRPEGARELADYLSLNRSVRQILHDIGRDMGLGECLEDKA